MADFDDDTSILILPTARKPGYAPPIDYVQYLDMGGELAKLGKEFWAEMAKTAAISAVKNIFWGSVKVMKN